MDMEKQCRRFTDKFKAQVGVEGVKGLKTLAALSAEFKIHPNQISSWKKPLLTKGPQDFCFGQRGALQER